MSQRSAQSKLNPIREACFTLRSQIISVSNSKFHLQSNLRSTFMLA